MKIGELAKLTGLAPSRIRFYEASGLIHAVERKANGYRDYDADAVWVLEMITNAQAAGFTLEQIRHLMPVNANVWRHDELLDGLKRKVEEIEVLQQQLARNKAQLLLVIDGIQGKPDGMACADNTQRVLNQLREDMAASKTGIDR
ncbi:MerR family transcriptional regulator [Pseudomonas guariconensis]|uniref:MerR family transcriptional regulator n=1 Tax=Pseudomonas guariconensis TaxID=1288410 RepID=UPI0018ABA691|nr:MerR family transcriptional regulator [Pseudomonas guariconensis]MBF8729890.1 MerR family transcriptional regulator [Pseudomonas guariconensis]